MSKITGKLREGVYLRGKRWSGDTFSEYADGEVDSAATEALMDEAAEEIERLERRLSQVATGSITGLPEHCAETSYMRAEIATEALGMDKPNPVDAETGGDCD